MFAWLFVLLLILIVAALITIPMRRRHDLFRRSGTYDLIGAQQPLRPPDEEKEADVDDHAPGGIRALAEEERRGFEGVWHSVENRFADDPKTAVAYADLLVSDVMEARGLPVKEMERRGVDVPVDPRIAETYRAAHQIAVRNKRGDGKAEYLRKAMGYYRALFEQLVGERSSDRAPSRTPERVVKRGTGRTHGEDEGEFRRAS